MTTFNTWRTVSVLWAGGAAMVAAVAILPAVAWAGTTWDGGGIDTNFTTGGNWNDDSAPPFTGGTSTLTFGAGGSTATVDTAADLARIILDRDVAFTIANGSGSLTLQGQDVGGVLTGLTASPATAGTTVAHTISESIALGATQAWNVANNGVGGTSLSVSGVISGAGVGLTKIDSGTLTLSGANTFSGPLTVADGTLSVNSWNSANTNGPLGNNAANVVLGSATSAGTLRYTGGIIDPPTAPRGIELAAGGGVIQLTGVGENAGRVHISGSSISGSGPLTINNPSGGRFLIVGSSTFTGPVAVQAGQLQANVVGAGSPFTPFGAGSNGLGSAVTVDTGAILTTYSNNETPTVLLGSLAGSGTVRTVASGITQLQIGGDDTSTTFSGLLQGTFAPVKVGAGTLTLSGANTFSGPLTVADGTLSINSWNFANTSGPLGNNAANVVFGSATSAGTLRYTGGSSNAPASLRGIELTAGGGVIELTSTDRGVGFVHLSGTSISGSGPLTINNPSGARFLIVGSSTFTGPVTVQAGELQGNVVGAGSPFTPFGAGNNGLGSAVTVNAGGILTTFSSFGAVTVRLGSLAGSGTVRTENSGITQLQIGGDDTSTTFSGQLQGTFAPVKVGAGTLTLSGSSSYTGSTTISTGRLELAGNGVLGSGSYAGTIANAGELVLGSDVAQILSGVISGTGTVTKSGAGTLSLSGANSYTGPLTVAEGVLSINSWNNVSTNGPLGNSAANVVLGSATSAGTLRYTGGNVELPNTLRGIELAAGGGVIELAGASRDSGRVHISGSSISGSGPLTINSPGMPRLLIVGSSTFSGPVTVQAGELQGNVVGAGSPFTPFGAGNNGLGSAVTVNAGGILTTFSSGGAVTVRLGSLTGSGTVRTEASGITQLQIGGDDTSTTFSGQLQGTFAPVKVGAGTLTLSGSSSYTGSTTVSAGRLVVDGSIFASSSVSVASGAELGGSGRVAAITGAGLVAPGNSPGILTAPSASLASGLDFAFEFTQGGAPTWSSAASSGNDVLRLTDATTPLVGTASSGNVFDIYFLATGETYIGGIFTDRNADFGSLLDAATFNYYARDAGGAFSYGGFNYASLAAADVTRSIVQVASADFAAGTVTNGYAMQFAVVPEPGSLALAGLGLAAAAAWLRRRT